MQSGLKVSTGIGIDYFLYPAIAQSNCGIIFHDCTNNNIMIIATLLAISSCIYSQFFLL